MDVAPGCATLLMLFSIKSKCTVSFRLKKIPLSGNKEPYDVAECLKDAHRLVYIHFMFKIKVQVEVCSVWYITSDCS